MLKFPRWKIITIYMTVAFGILFAMPNFFKESQLAEFPSWLPSNQVNLGLDLQGGSHLLLQVDLGDIRNERLAAVQDDVRRTLRQNSIQYTGLALNEGAVTLRLRNLADLDSAIDLIEALALPVNQNALTLPVSDLEIDSTDDGRITITMTPEGIAERQISVVQQSIEIVRRRVDELGTREPTIQREGSDRILVQVPGLQDPDQLKEMLNTQAKLSFHLVDASVSPDDIRANRVPPGVMVVSYAEDPSIQIGVQRRAMVSGENLTDAQPSFDQNGLPSVSLRFDSTGARQFGRATTDNVGRQFAILLDDEVISAPRINEPIPGGTGQITGNFTVASATDLAILLRAGALPAKLDVLEESTVGPDQGQENIDKGKYAAVIGFVMVIVFIVMAYGTFGVFANVALVVNMVLILGALSMLQATLTLPGIAGIVLTIGMAVDANVLVFERIREELKSGSAPLAAVDTGYSQAMSTILDANITTLIAAVILFQFGSGPVKGFAVTLAIGIVTSVFTAVTLTRLILATYLRWRKPETLKL